jgi:hypothetical protein
MALKTLQEKLEHYAVRSRSKRPEAGEKAACLLRLFADAPTAEDPRRQKLIHSV